VGVINNGVPQGALLARDLFLLGQRARLAKPMQSEERKQVVIAEDKIGRNFFREENDANRQIK
jgi:hypothetical protein